MPAPGWGRGSEPAAAGTYSYGITSLSSSTPPVATGPTRHPTARRLLEVAIDDIDAHGEAGLRLDAVVERAGVAITAVYHHFGNREALIEAAQAERYARTIWPVIVGLGARLEGVDDRETVERVVLDALTVSIDPAFAENRIRRVSALGAILGRPTLARGIAHEQQRVNEYLASLLRPLQERGLLRADLDLVGFSAWITGLVLSRVVIELDAEPGLAAAWDDLTRMTTRHVLFGVDAT